jgi:predicted Fe-Mo cluster-binding NifX family protein
MAMMLAIPVESPGQWEAPLSDHFGHAPYFACVDLAARTCVIIATESARTAVECAPLEALKEAGCGTVLCRHMGRGALMRCFDLGLRVQPASGMTVAEAVAAFDPDSEESLSEDALCEGGHGHGTI